MRPIVASFLGCALLCCPTVAGSTAIPPPGDASADTLSLREADLVRLVETHPRLAAARAEARAAAAGVRAAGAFPNPALDASLLRESGGAGPREEDDWTVELALPLGWVTRRGPQVASARAQSLESRSRAGLAGREAARDLHAAFWSLAHDQERVAALEELHAQTAELARVVRRQVETGEKRPTEAARIEIELQRVAVELEGARADREVRERQLRLWLPPGERRPVRADADLAASLAVPVLEQALARAADHHPALLAARARVRGLEAERSLERWSRIPEIEVRGLAGRERERPVRGAGLALAVPLFDWNGGRVTGASARLEAGRQDLRRAELELAAEVIEAHGEARSARQAAGRFHDEILPRATVAAEVMEKAYRLGEAAVLEVIDARRVLAETRLESLAAQLRARLAGGRLEALEGPEESR